jgi:hypothetical protein
MGRVIENSGVRRYGAAVPFITRTPISLLPFGVKPRVGRVDQV